MIYLDNAATTKALDLSLAAFAKNESSQYFNSSASYSPAKKVKLELENARSSIMSSLGADSDYWNLVFTSGASQSNQLVFESLLKTQNFEKNNIVISSAEHPSISKYEGFFKQIGLITRKAPSKYGVVSVEKLLPLIDNSTKLVSIIHTSNLTGSINDIPALCKAVKKINPALRFHSDATQSLCKNYFNFKDFEQAGVDALSFSAHKCYAPKGIGLLFLKKGYNPSLCSQGGQEGGVRGGTVPTSLAIATSISIEYISKKMQEFTSKVNEISSLLIDGVSRLKNGFCIRSENVNYSPLIVPFGIIGIPSEVLQRLLSEKEIYVGVNSACSSNSNEKSSAFLDMGYDAKIASCTARASFSIYNTRQEINTVLGALDEINRKFL